MEVYCGVPTAMVTGTVEMLEIGPGGGGMYAHNMQEAQIEITRNHNALWPLYLAYSDGELRRYRM